MISHSSLLRIVRKGRRRRKGIHKFFDFVGDALSGLPKLLDLLVVRMAGGDT